MDILDEPYGFAVSMNGPMAMKIRDLQWDPPQICRVKYATFEGNPVEKSMSEAIKTWGHVIQ